MRLSVFGALVLTLLALGTNNEIMNIHPSIYDPVPVTEDGYWGDWSKVLS